MQKPKINLREIAAKQLQRVREQRARLTEIRKLGRAVRKDRNWRPRLELLVVPIAFIFLVGALFLMSSRDETTTFVDATPGPGTEVFTDTTTLTTTVTVPQVALGATATATLVGLDRPTSGPIGGDNGYPAPTISVPFGIATPFGELTPVPTGAVPTFEAFPSLPTPDFSNPLPTSDPASLPTVGQPQFPTSDPGTLPTVGQPERPTSDAGAGFPTITPFNPYPGPNLPTGGRPTASVPQPGDNAPAPAIPTMTPYSPPTPQPRPTDVPPPRPTNPPPPRPTSPPAPSQPTATFAPIPTTTPRRSTATSAPYPGGGEPPSNLPPTSGPRATTNLPPPPTSGPRPTTNLPPPPTSGPRPTADLPPTSGPKPTPAAPPTSTPKPTAVPPTEIPPTATPVPPTATPTPLPYTVISGNVRWTAADGPHVLTRDTVLAAGSTLTIEPGVEVQLRPAVEFTIEGQLRAQGSAGAPVRFIGPSGRWNGIFGQPGSSINLSHTELRQAGRGGVAIRVTSGSLTIANSALTDSGGGISTTDTAVDIRRTRITGNNLPSGPALLLGASGDATTLIGNIIGGNILPRGTPQVKVQAGGGSGPLDIQGNLFYGASGTTVEIKTSAPLDGTVRCNTFDSGTIGLMLNASTASGRGFGLAVDTNAFTGQSTYGASSTVPLTFANNWWGDPSGPADAQRNAQGQGTRVGVNVTFEPWLSARPGCAPTP